MTKLDYREGRELAIKNVESHLNIAKQLLSSDNRGSAVSHSLLAYEEAAKAVYCSMVASSLVDSKEIRSAFKLHGTKATLFYEIFENDIKIEHDGSSQKIMIQGQEVTDKLLRSLSQIHPKSLEEHSNIRNRGFYVDIVDEKWGTPNDIPPEDAQKEVKDNVIRALALVSVSDIILKVKPSLTLLNNIKLNISSEEDVFTIIYDEI